MKLYFNKKYLQDVTRDNPTMLLSEEQRYEMERLQGMILHDIRFCSLVTGFRGTGKSSFTKYVLEHLDTPLKPITVIFNATRYDDYETFLKRLIRELYFQMNRIGKASERLENIYLHTFYDIKESSSSSAINQSDYTDQNAKSVKTLYSDNVDISKLIDIVLKYCVSIILLLLIFLNVDITWVRVLCSVLVAIGAIVTSVLERHYINESSTEEITTVQNDTKREQAKSKTEETLYDKEIAEYYVFDEIKSISDKGNTLIFVIDELDKISTDEELEKIFHDLKPLFLSSYCNFILVAGKNMDKYLYLKQNEKDPIAASIFSQRIYIPLSTIQDMRTFAEQFYQMENQKEQSEEFYVDDRVQTYLNYKIFEAKGVKRNFVNSILADIRWDKDKPYVDLSNLGKSNDFNNLFNAFEKAEEYVIQNYTDSKRDELLLSLYDCSDRIQNEKHSEFSKSYIIGTKEQIAQACTYVNVAEQMDVYEAFFNELVIGSVLDLKEDKYKWHSDVIIKGDVKSERLVTREIDGELYGYVELLIDRWKSIGTILTYFAFYNDIIDQQPEVIDSKTESYRPIVSRMIVENYRLYEKFENIFDSLEKLTLSRIKKEDIVGINKLIRELSDVKPDLVEELLRYTYINKFKVKILDESISQEQRSYRFFDIVGQFPTTQNIVIVECKYQKNCMKSINPSLLKRLAIRLQEYKAVHKYNDFKFNLVIVTDQISENDILKYENQSQEYAQEYLKSNNAQVNVIPLHEYDIFEHQMDSLNESI